jgi:hypothetical protein
LTDDDFGILTVPLMASAITLVATLTIARIEFTRSPLSAIRDNLAEWFAWSTGDVDGSGGAATAAEYFTQDMAESITAFRVVNVSGVGTYDVYFYGAQGADRSGCWVTPEGGFCELKEWDSTLLVPTVAGELVSFNDPGEVTLAVAGANLPYAKGVIYDSDCPPGGIVPVVTDGKAEILLVDVTGSTIGDLASLSTTIDGRMEMVTPPVAATWSEYTNWIGQALEVVAGGVDQVALVRLM